VKPRLGSFNRSVGYNSLACNCQNVGEFARSNMQLRFDALSCFPIFSVCNIKCQPEVVLHCAREESLPNF